MSEGAYIRQYYNVVANSQPAWDKQILQQDVANYFDISTKQLKDIIK